MYLLIMLLSSPHRQCKPNAQLGTEGHLTLLTTPVCSFLSSLWNCLTSQSISSKPSIPLSCLPALLLNLSLGKDKFTADLPQ